MARVVIFARYSSTKQRDASIEDQIRLCKAELARHDDWILTDVFIERALSGAGAGRFEYERLLQAINNRAMDVVVAEGLDRLTREQDEAPSLYKRCRYNRVQIITVQEGLVNELHVGLKGTMNALYLKDLGQKTHRGLEGRIEAGASAGGISYGYDIDHDAPETGQRVINPAEALVILRICERYRDGQSPRAIAHDLNGDRISGPRGGLWTQSTINGNRERGTGILNNELIVGRLVWNRLIYEKDPDTKKRRSRLRPPEDVRSVDVPHLRIVDDELWNAVKARQDSLRIKAEADGLKRPAFWRQQRPRYLLSGLCVCGRCGGGYSTISRTHLGCSAARNKGAAACSNRRTISREDLEHQVLAALSTHLMAPEVYRSFVAGFTDEWNKLQNCRGGEREAKERELKTVEAAIGRLVRAIEGGAPFEPLNARLSEHAKRKISLETEVASIEEPAPRLMPNLADLYQAKIKVLRDALDDPDASAVIDQIRSLIIEVRLTPDKLDLKSPLTIELRGELAAMLALGSGEHKNAATPERVAAQMKLVAGAGFEPAAFRL